MAYETSLQRIQCAEVMRVFLLLRKRRILSGLLAAALMLSFSAAVRFYKTEMVFGSKLPTAAVVIDAGHGGVDGGAVAKDGTVESGINLSIALTLKELFLFCGIEPVMIRETDVSIHSEEAETISQKKVSDLKNRVALINSHPDAVLISIHQNSLPTAPSVRGAQAFYNPVDGADTLAHAIQDALNIAINPQRAKTEKQIPSTIYLMQKAQIPAVLVECGFLSNEEETRLLQTNAHQLRLSLAILCGYYAPKEEVPQ